MKCEYTSKTVAQIKVIIGELEDLITSSQASGKQKIDYKGTTYEISEYSEAVRNDIRFWEDRLCIAGVQEGTKTKTRYFSRGDGMC